MKPLQVIQRVLALLRSGWQRPPSDQLDPYAWWPVPRRPPGDQRDPYAWRPVLRRPRPTPRSSSVAVAEPDE
jgi:hypothetical protein